MAAPDNSLSRHALLENCITEYETVLGELVAGHLLPRVGLSLLQHHLYNEVLDQPVPVLVETSVTEMSVQKMLEMRHDRLTSKQFTVLVTGNSSATTLLA